MKTPVPAKQRATVWRLSDKGWKTPAIAEKVGLPRRVVGGVIARYKHAGSWQKRRMTAWEKAHAAEAASKAALEAYCEKHGWKIAFFEGATGAPRTGIIDAIAFRLDRKNCDLLDIRLVQLKGGNAGVSAREIARLKKAAVGATVRWLIAEFDPMENALQLLPDDPA